MEIKCPVCRKPMTRTDYGWKCWVSKPGIAHPSPEPVVVPDA